MNITKEQVEGWLSNNFLERRFGFITDNDIADAFNKCFNDLAPKYEWVSVDKMLPQNDFSVIACVDDDVAECIFRMLDDGSYYFDGLVGVTHWMPLPEPPK